MKLGFMLMLFAIAPTILVTAWLAATFHWSLIFIAFPLGMLIGIVAGEIDNHC